MNMSPYNSRILMQTRQRDLLAEARQARLAREAEPENRTAPALAYPGARRRWRRFRLAGLFGA